MAARAIATNEQGYRIGGAHHNARHSDDVVRRVRDMHEFEGKTYKQISKELGIPYWTVANWGSYKERCQTPFLGTPSRRRPPDRDHERVR